MNKKTSATNITICAILACLPILLTGCKFVSYPGASIARCDDPLEYYNELSSLVEKDSTEKDLAEKNSIEKSLAEKDPATKNLATKDQATKKLTNKNTTKKQSVKQPEKQLEKQIDKSELTKTASADLSSKTEASACLKLNKAIWFSMPSSKQQNDKKALTLLKDLKQAEMLSEDDQRFNNMLLQHVSQRQELRNMIGSQDQRLKQTETQLDQLKSIEVEIDKKERSVSSPVDE